jgi:hypothetical protein
VSVDVEVNPLRTPRRTPLLNGFGSDPFVRESLVKSVTISLAQIEQLIRTPWPFDHFVYRSELP